jgi:hypothetical protein
MRSTPSSPSNRQRHGDNSRGEAILKLETEDATLSAVLCVMDRGLVAEGVGDPAVSGALCETDGRGVLLVTWVG